MFPPVTEQLILGNQPSHSFNQVTWSGNTLGTQSPISSLFQVRQVRRWLCPI